MLNATTVDVRLGCRLSGVVHSDAVLSSTTFLCASDTIELNVTARYIIDASYDGEIMTGTGSIDTAHGREASSVFNESLAGANYMDDPNESFDKQNLSLSATFANGELIPGISPQAPPPAGSGDDRLMAFSYFPCVTDNTSNSVPFYPPPEYNPDDYTLLQRQIDGVIANGHYPNGPDLSYFSEWHAYNSMEPPFSPSNKLLLCCGRGPVNCDEPDLNHGYATATFAERQRIQAAHKRYLLGSLYYMANDARSPNYTRYAIGRWGLCADEYKDSGFWPPQIYVRISNRLQGDYIMTQNNITNPRVKPDSVSMAAWEFDQHTMARYAVPDPNNASRLIAMNEGYMRASLPPDAQHPGGEENWYDVPFSVMVPKRGQANNLLVPVAISASSIAYSSTRIESMFSDLGTAAGVAAALALRTGNAVQDSNITLVQEILVNKYKQKIHGPP